MKNLDRRLMPLIALVLYFGFQAVGLTKAPSSTCASCLPIDSSVLASPAADR